MEAYLNEVVHYLAAQSWQIAVLTLAVAAATFALRHRSAHVRYLLWLIVLAKCLVPPVHVTPLRVLPPVLERTPSSSLPPARNPDPSPIPSPILPDTLKALHEALSFPVDRGLDSPPSTSVAILLSPLGRAAAILWLIGAASYLAMNLLRALRGHYWLRKRRKPLANGMQADTTNLPGAYGARHMPKVYVVDGVSQPFVWGLLRGSIYVPPSFLSLERPEHRRDILAHELSHVLRFDAGVNALQVIAQSLFWFHPFVWWANSKIRQEREKCCDEMVIARLHTTPKDYSTAIVETLAHAKESGRSVPSLAVASPLRHIEGRIKTILRPGKRFHARPSLLVVTLVVLAALAAVPTTLMITALAVEPVALPVPLAELPRTLNGWTGEDLEIPTTVQEYMRANFADDFINRRYTNKASQQWADLYVVYCSSRPGVILSHGPEVCFPANGWSHDGTKTSQIISHSGRPIDCLIHRFRKPSPQPMEVTVLCFYVVNGRISVNEQDISHSSARRPNVSGDPARYVAQVELSSTTEASVRSAASAMADAVLDALPDPNGRIPAPRSAEAHLEQEANNPVSSGSEAETTGEASGQPRFAARTFNSEMAFDVLVELTPHSAFSEMRSDSGLKRIGATPSAAPLEIPACWIWWVQASASVQNWDLLAHEMNQKQVPGLVLWSVTDAGLRHLAGSVGLRLLAVKGPEVSDEGVAQLKALTQLQTLRLEGTRVTDAGLAHLSAMTRLELLFLCDNAITDAGLVHLKGLTRLQQLQLSGDAITDAGLAHLKGMATLQSLDLAGTKITDAGLAHLKGMTALQSLNLSGIQVTGVGMEHLKALTGLRSLLLQGCPISDAGLAHLNGLTGLQGLGLSGTRITDAGMTHLEGMTQLQWLELSNTSITDEGLAHIQSLRDLKSLSLDHTQVTDGGLEHLRGLTGLQQLSLQGKSITDAGLEHLKSLTELRRLELFGAAITDAGLIHLQNMTKLQELRLWDTKITGRGLEYLKGMSQLESLDLQNDPITDAGLADIEGLTELKGLIISYSKVTDAGLEYLNRLTQLESLSLAGSPITGPGLEHLKNLTGLRRLDLRNTRITDVGLEHLKNLTGLKHLHVGGAQITEAGIQQLRQSLPNLTIDTLANI